MCKLGAAVNERQVTKQQRIQEIILEVKEWSISDIAELLEQTYEVVIK